MADNVKTSFLQLSFFFFFIFVCMRSMKGFIKEVCTIRFILGKEVSSAVQQFGGCPIPADTQDQGMGL